MRTRYRIAVVAVVLGAAAGIAVVVLHHRAGFTELCPGVRVADGPRCHYTRTLTHLSLTVGGLVGAVVCAAVVLAGAALLDWLFDD